MSGPLCQAKRCLKAYNQIRTLRQAVIASNSSLLHHHRPPCQPQVLSVRHNTQHRVVLLPEYPGQDNKVNASLKTYKAGLPDFQQMTEASCYFGLGQRLMEFESAVCRMEDSVEAGGADWAKLLGSLEVARLELENIFASVALLEIATDRLDMDRFKQLTRRAERALLTRYDSKSIHQFITSDSVQASDSEDQVILERYKVEYKHAGYGLSDKKYMELTSQWLKRLGEAQRDTRFKLTTLTQRFRHVIRDPAIVREFPVDLLKAMSADSSQPAKGPWSVSLHPYIYRKFLAYCPERRLRWNAYNAMVCRGSSTADYYLNCAGHVKDIRQHRLDQAIVTGYNNYAEMSMVTKMAANVENVQTMIGAMVGPARAAQEQELASLQEYAETRGFTDKIREFDVAFFRRKQMRTELGLEEEAMRDYFPLPTVLEGIFGLIKQQFGLEFTLVTPKEGADGGSGPLGSLWHPDCQLYKVVDTDDSQTLGHCYLDPYIRDDKGYQGGDKGWFIPLRQHSVSGDSEAVGAIVMALTNPGYGKPSLLNLAEVELVAKQAGKVVQHFLGRTKWAEISGRNVEWDCLDVVPELMSLWLSAPGVLQSLSSHWSSGERLTSDQVQALTSARLHLAGYDLSQELFKAAYDLAFYAEDYEAEQYGDLARRLADQYLVLPREKEDAFPLYFEEMLTGHWAAGYYCQLWSRMIAADVFSAYTEAGLDNATAVTKLSRKFKQIWLQSGGSQNSADLFRSFRGRDPTPEALLVSLGLQHVAQPKARTRKQ